MDIPENYHLKITKKEKVSPYSLRDAQGHRVLRVVQTYHKSAHLLEGVSLALHEHLSVGFCVTQ